VLHAAKTSAFGFNWTVADLEIIETSDKWLQQDTESRRLAGLARSFQLRLSALHEGAWHNNGSRRWGSAYDFTLSRTWLIGRIEADCRAPAPPAAPLPGLPQANPQTKATILVFIAQRCASLLARGRA
jgi:hypothetical protein